jgi:hypothetical protein
MSYVDDFGVNVGPPAFVDNFGVAGDGGPDCPFCGREMSTTTCFREECPGEVLQCEVIVFHGSRNQDSPMFGPDEQCENDVEPGSTVCADHAYVIDEPSFTAEAER